MKKLLLFIISLFMFSSCVKNDVETVTYDKTQKEKFERLFEITFGQPSTNQDWGFGETEILDLTDLSNVSTRGHNVNRNEWNSKFVVPANVTSAEEQAVLNELAKGSGDRDSKMTVNWPDYFVYHVHKGTDSYPDHNGTNIGVASDKMNHLQAVFSNGSMEHINDFNSGQQNANWWTIEGATLMLNSTTYDFAYHNSTDNKYHNCFTVIDGKNIGYPGFYYICFDFLANGDIEQPSNKNMGVDRNYNYTDWIIRISPAEYKGTKRIIAEDLGTDDDSDFDYNDVVFDAVLANEWVGSLNANKLVAHITLRAAGGTMPLYVAGNEVHQLFGVDTGVMVNTNNGTVSKPPVQFTTIIGDADWSNSKSIKDIPVKVVTNKGEIILESNVGQASEKLCVSTGYNWCDERQPIQDKYPDFPRFVTDKNVQWYQVY